MQEINEFYFNFVYKILLVMLYPIYLVIVFMLVWTGLAIGGTQD